MQRALIYLQATIEFKLPIHFENMLQQGKMYEDVLKGSLHQTVSSFKLPPKQQYTRSVAVSAELLLGVEKLCKSEVNDFDGGTVLRWSWLRQVLHSTRFAVYWLDLDICKMSQHFERNDPGSLEEQIQRWTMNLRVRLDLPAWCSGASSPGFAPRPKTIKGPRCHVESKSRSHVLM